MRHPQRHSHSNRSNTSLNKVRRTCHCILVCASIAASLRAPGILNSLSGYVVISDGCPKQLCDMAVARINKSIGKGFASEQIALFRHLTWAPGTFFFPFASTDVYRTDKLLSARCAHGWQNSQGRASSLTSSTNRRHTISFVLSLDSTFSAALSANSPLH